MSDQPVTPELTPTASPASKAPPAASPPGRTEPVSLPLPGPTDTVADLHRALQQALQAPPRPVAEPAAPEPPKLAAEKNRDLHPFVFHGNAREYFRIWIVNTLLTLLTAGIFAAWAKVRKRRYLRGNTELMGHRFDYRADPRRILVGNLVVALLFLAYMVVGEVYPWVRLGALGVGLLLLPWVVVRSLAFNAHNTSYRGMRFYFHQTYGMAALTYLAQGLVTIVTLGIYYPAWVRNQREFTLGNHRLGDAFFRFSSPSGPFYGSYIVSGAMVFGAAMLGGMLMAGTMAVTKHKVATLTELVPFFAVYGSVLFIAKQYLFARLFNQVWNHTRLDDHRFVARLDTGHWIKLQCVNLGALIASCGLLYPWAVVRSTSYALGCLQFEPAGPIEKIGRLGKDEGSAFSETAGEFIGMDFGL
jgi:uncharacterized membrane protein YjgN (DUF898 family)